MDQLDYERSVVEESFRQEFLNGIDLEEARPYIKRVSYKPKQAYSDNIIYTDNTIMMRTSNLPAKLLGIKNVRSTISVYPCSFTLQNIGEFKSMLIDHEGYHAKDIFEEPEILLLPLIKLKKVLNIPLIKLNIDKLDELYLQALYRNIIGELRANRNQLKNIDKRETSSSFKKSLASKIEGYEKLGLKFATDFQPS
ncbi:MAG: hypothetical protein AABX48_00550 [Nanoarchaeota archaeon]